MGESVVRGRCQQGTEIAMRGRQLSRIIPSEREVEAISPLDGVESILAGARP